MILSKITKIVATRCHILRLKCTKFDFGWGFAPDPAGGTHSAPPDPLAVLLLIEGRGDEGNGEEGREGEEAWVGRRRGGEEKGRGGTGEGRVVEEPCYYSHNKLSTHNSIRKYLSEI